MRLKEIFRFEFLYQMRRPSTWLLFIVVATVSYLNTGDDTLAEALYEDFYLNSPFAIARTTVIGTLIWLVAAGVVAGAAAARDVETLMHPLAYTAPVSKRLYLGGRFVAAFCLNALILVAVQIGIAIGIYQPGIDPAVIGPFGVAPFIASYLVISLPNAFVATAVQFLLSTRSGRSTSGYFGSFLLIFMGFFVSALLLFYSGLGSLLDPVGIRFIIEDIAHMWTPTERKWRMLLPEGTVLSNRLVWFGVGLAALSITYLTFRFTHRVAKRAWWQRRKTKPVDITENHAAIVATPFMKPDFSFITRLHQTISAGWHSFRVIFFGRTGLSLLIGLPLLTIIIATNNIQAGGVPRIPTTSLMITVLAAPLSSELSPWVILPLLLVIFAGELVWRDRDLRLDDLNDSMPVSGWSMLLGKFFAMALIIATVMLLLMIGGMLSQFILGYFQPDILLYIQVFFGLQFVEYFLFAILVIVVHVIVNQKYIGHLVAIVASVFIAVPAMFYVEHNLLIYDSGPQWSHSEMRSFGTSLGPWIWFKLYWAAWAILLSVVAGLLWSRGKDVDIRSRLRTFRRRINGPVVLTAAFSMLLILTFGGFIFYNTNILNKYYTRYEYNELLASYERLYGKYKDIDQPRLSATELEVEIYPDRSAASITGTYVLVNQSARSMDSIHVATIPGARMRSIFFNQPASTILTDDLRGHRIYALDRPLRPGDSIKLGFDMLVEPKGFGNRGANTSVVPNGTFFTNADWLPSIGYQTRRELMKPLDRREHGLPPRRLIPSLYDHAARMISADRTAFDAVIVTDDDQVAVAPGKLVKQWVKGSRRYFHYVTDHPIDNDYSIFSADYEVHEARWQNVDIRIFHHPSHKQNVERFVSSIRASLDYNTKHFGPYPYGHITFVEVRGNEIGMHADPSLIRFAEGTALWDPGSQSVDLPFSVVAHETSHQWWGHQLEPAFTEGAGVLSESLAQFSAMKIMEETKGHEQLERVLSFMRNPFPYPPIRRGEPLIRAMDSYLNYRKGPFALQALCDYLGNHRVTTALGNLFASHPPGKLPLTTTLDLYNELKAVTPDSLQYLVRDLFEVNTFWDLNMERASAQQTKDNMWEVTLDLMAHKITVDTAGVETEVPMNDWIEVGVFDNNPLYLKKHRIRPGKQTIVITVPSKPTWAGIDPYHVFDWEEREDDNNRERVKIGL